MSLTKTGAKSGVLGQVLDVFPAPSRPAELKLTVADVRFLHCVLQIFIFSQKTKHKTHISQKATDIIMHDGFHHG